MLKEIPKPIVRTPTSYFVGGIALLIVLSLLVGTVVDSIEENAIEEYLEVNYEELYDSAYSDGYDCGYEDGIAFASDNSLCAPQFATVCDVCSIYYDPSSVFNFGFGLCDDCGRSMLSDCVFCGALTFEWGASWYAVCPDCMGDAVEQTDIEAFLEDFNENR